MSGIRQPKRTWASFIKELMEAKGVTCEEFGRECGVAKQTVKQWRAAIREPWPKHQETLRRIAAEHNEKVQGSLVT